MKTLLDQITRPIAFFDIEGTGLDISKDRIITIAIKRLSGDGSTQSAAWMVHPGFPIPKESTEIHGITDADVAHCPPFESVASEVLNFLFGCDLGGYNLRNYDIPLLYEEFSRAGLDWNLDGVHVIDASMIFRLKEPRDLTAAVAKYCGRKMEDAHDAGADVQATIDVFFGQLAAYPDLREMNLEQVATFSKGEDKRLDLAGKLALDKDGDPCFMVGNPRGRKVRDDISFGYWMLNKDFSNNTKTVLKKVLGQIQGNEETNKSIF